MTWLLPLLPLIGGVAILALPASRLLVAATALLVLGLDAALAVAPLPDASVAWGAGLSLSVAVEPLVRVPILLVPLVGAAVVAWAAGHEERAGLPRLVGLLVVFVGTMQLLVLAGDLLTLTIGWELVGAVSWALIGHRLQEDGSTRSAVYAYNVTRAGGLGLLLAAGAALASTGSLAFDDLRTGAESPWGSLLAGGILLAAASKSAQLPFSPWLFRAMDGPSSVSALLHSSTMVAAGAWIVLRLHEPLSAVPWWEPVVLGLGLATAVAGGVVAALQPDAKRLLAASTSAQYGLVFAAAGAGSVGAGMAHVVTHAGFKALLFLAAGTAIGAAGTGLLRGMALGRALPIAAGASLVGVLALAALPPLGGAWSKEEVVKAVGEQGAALALVAIAAGTLSAWYAARFQVLAFGRGRATAERPGGLERAALLALAAGTALLGVLWVPAVHEAARRAIAVELPKGRTWEIALSVTLAVLAFLASWAWHRRAEPRSSAVADWLGLPAAIDRGVVAPALLLARACARLDDRVVDAGVRGAGHVGRALSALLSSGPEAAVDRGIRGLVHGVLRTARGSVVADETLLDGGARTLARGALRAAAAARVTDDAGVDAGVDGLAAGIGGAGRQSVRAQTGRIPNYYLLITGGLLVLVLLAFPWS